jgi:hypothetical protein
MLSVPAIAGNRIVYCDAVFVDGELTVDKGVEYDDPSYRVLSTSTASIYTMVAGDELVVTVKGSANCKITTSATDEKG